MTRDKKIHATKKKVAQFAIHCKKDKKNADSHGFSKDKHKKKQNEEKKNEKKKNCDTVEKFHSNKAKNFESNKAHHHEGSGNRSKDYQQQHQQHDNLMGQQYKNPSPTNANRKSEENKNVCSPGVNYHKQIEQKNIQPQKQDDGDNLYENLSVWRQN
ncbi:Hypothetical protein SRAE_2000053900 [Strongyloides ratti]|uniref:Uncharacterized protein n=1 Tax=Strongyloides ratti TaxID=34506 RepID=A0A090MXQ9_STRRB|nr:Hypothetical protein SRAE_2000053900 [Strongyloides ratti]CEF65864.1 Hypothetical protein SRAE_2000053900 [Strongyloides ratti]